MEAVRGTQVKQAEQELRDCWAGQWPSELAARPNKHDEALAAPVTQRTALPCSPFQHATEAHGPDRYHSGPLLAPTDTERMGRKGRRLV